MVFPKREKLIIEKCNVLIDKDEEVAYEINNFFVNIGSDITKCIPKNNNHISSFIKTPNEKSIINDISCAEVILAIKQLRPNASCGYSNISAKVLQRYSNFLAPAMTNLINNSIYVRKFPDSLKKGKVIPIHKGGDKRNMNNLRPITTSNPVTKVFEKIIDNRLNDYLTTKNIISSKQYGFTQRSVPPVHA